MHLKSRTKLFFCPFSFSVGLHFYLALFIIANLAIILAPAPSPRPGHGRLYIPVIESCTKTTSDPVAEDSTAYGLDFARKRLLHELLDKLSGVAGIEWIRVMYAYPHTVGKELTSALAGNDKLVPYLDIPIQHISSRMLRAMKRGVSKDQVNVAENQPCLGFRALCRRSVSRKRQLARSQDKPIRHNAMCAFGQGRCHAAWC